MNINPFDILKNAQKIQEQMGSFQEKLGNIVASGSAGGGMVEVDLNGRMDLIAVRIAPDAVDPDDIEMLQDLIIAAYTNAQEKIKEDINREMGTLAGMSGMPGMQSLFPGMGNS